MFLRHDVRFGYGSRIVHKHGELNNILSIKTTYIFTSRILLLTTQFIRKQPNKLTSSAAETIDIANTWIPWVRKHILGRHHAWHDKHVMSIVWDKEIHSGRHHLGMYLADKRVCSETDRMCQPSVQNVYVRSFWYYFSNLYISTSPSVSRQSAQTKVGRWLKASEHLGM